MLLYFLTSIVGNIKAFNFYSVIFEIQGKVKAHLSQSDQSNFHVPSFDELSVRITIKIIFY